MPRLVGFLQAIHFYFHAHALRDPSLSYGPAVVLRDGQVLDCSPDLDAAGVPSRPNPAYLRIAYPLLREVPFDPDACASPYEALWSQVVPDAIAVEPLDCAHGFFEPVRAPGLDVLRDQIAALRDRVRAVTAGLEIRVGLAPSRLLARIAARGEHILLPGRERAFLAQAPLEWLPIDGRSRGSLAGLGVKRIADLASLPRGTLFHHLKPDAARQVLAMLSGRGDSHVRALYPSPRLEEKLAPLDGLDEVAISTALAGASGRLFARLQKRRRWPRALGLVLDPLHGPPVRAEGELIRPPARADDLVHRFTTLLRGLWRGQELCSLSLFVEDLQAFSPGQYGFGFSADPAGLTILDQVMDALRERFGERALLRAGQLPDHRRWAEQILFS
jgi:hypothetical protein